MPFPFQRKLDGRQGSPRSQAKSGVSRKRSSRLRSEVQTDERNAVQDRRSSNDEDGSNDEDVSMEDGSRQPPRRRKNTLASNLTAQRQARDAEYAAEDADNDNAESAVVIDVDEDEEAVTDHRGDMRRGLLNRHNSARSQRSQLSGRLGTRAAALRTDDDDGMTFTPSLSRRPSDAAKVEEDVCYPMLEMREVDMEVREGGGPRAHADGRGSPREHEHHRSRYHDQGNHPGLPGVLPNFPFPFDFGALEEFCGDERRSNGVAIPRTKGSYSHGRTPPGSKALSFSPEQEPSVLRRRNGEVPSRRQRKLSESTGHGVGRYQRKLALFEGNSNGAVDGPKYLSPPATSKTPLLADGGKMSTGFGAVDTSSRTMTGSNEKARPYRFSFYSNALPSTIHARSLAELPADGQNFEELFVGRQPDTPPEDWEASVPDAMGNGFDTMLPARQPGVDSSGKNTPDVSALGHATSDGKLGAQSNTASRTGLNAYSTKPRTNIMRSNEDAEANTWWLDVLNPTDAEMKVLGKVFGIHPLTIEDILMEETREKIELFRNYYLVCFRSFDQDPYSPTYLEPLNMYIIVMREGTLSFHFRGTPHPQNVRRRIKQLKDFINVTSDWISYALIDDITDAFGPLIQNIEYEVDSIDELVLILKDAEQSDMLRRIGTCRKKVMGLLRLMGNKADVVKGLAKRCNENWSVAPKSDIGLYLSDIQVSASTQSCIPADRSAAGPLDHHDPELESLRKDSIAITLELPGADIYRNDRCQQSDQRRPVQADCAGYRSHSDESGYRESQVPEHCDLVDENNIARVYGA